jgi:hypothetical protein
VSRAVPVGFYDIPEVLTMRQWSSVIHIYIYILLLITK